MRFGILGTGVMGRGWIVQCAMTGHEVHCHDSNTDVLAGVMESCRTLAGKAAAKAKLGDPDIARRTAALIHPHADRNAFLAAAKTCDVFLEAIFEDLNLKCGVLRDLVPQLPEHVYLWSNTSSLDIDALGEASQRPERSIVTHGMNPVPMMPGVEVVPGRKTSAETIEMTQKTLLAMNKAPFVASNVPGFWINRLFIPMAMEALRFLEQGKISVADADVGLSTSLGHPQGMFKLLDFITIPTTLRVALEMFQASNDPRMYPPQILARMIRAGELGANTGKGFYDWSDARNPKPRDLSHYQIHTVDHLLGAVGDIHKR